MAEINPLKKPSAKDEAIALSKKQKYQATEADIDNYIKQNNPSYEEINILREALGMPPSIKATAGAAAKKYGMPLLEIAGDLARPAVDPLKAVAFGVPADLLEAYQKNKKLPYGDTKAANKLAVDTATNIISNLGRSVLYGPLRALGKTTNFLTAQPDNPPVSEDLDKKIRPYNFRDIEDKTGVLKSWGAPENIYARNIFLDKEDRADREAFLEEYKIKNPKATEEEMDIVRDTLGLSIAVPTTTALDVLTDIGMSHGFYNTAKAPISLGIATGKKLPYLKKPAIAAEKLLTGIEDKVSGAASALGNQVSKVPILGKPTVGAAKTSYNMLLGGGASGILDAAENRAYLRAFGLNSSDIKGVKDRAAAAKIIKDSGVVGAVTGKTAIAENAAKELDRVKNILVSNLQKLDPIADRLKIKDITGKLRATAAEKGSLGFTTDADDLYQLADDIESQFAKYAPRTQVMQSQQVPGAHPSYGPSGSSPKAYGPAGTYSPLLMGGSWSIPTANGQIPKPPMLFRNQAPNNPRIVSIPATPVLPNNMYPSMTGFKPTNVPSQSAPVSWWKNLSTNIKPPQTAYQKPGEAVPANLIAERQVSDAVDASVRATGTDLADDYLSNKAPYNVWKTVAKAARRSADQNMLQRPVGLLDVMSAIGGGGYGYANSDGGGVGNVGIGAVAAPIAMRALRNLAPGSLAKSISLYNKAVKTTPISLFNQRVEEGKLPGRYKIMNQE